MTTIGDLTTHNALPNGTPSGELDPFRDRDALFDSQVLDIAVDAMRSRAALLLEFRTGFNFRDEGDAAVLWADGVSEASWLQPERGGRMAWGIARSSGTESQHGLTMSISCEHGTRLVMTAQQWWFAIGSVPGIDRIPDYTEATDVEIRRMNPQWASEIQVRAGSSWPGFQSPTAPPRYPYGR